MQKIKIRISTNNDIKMHMPISTMDMCIFVLQWADKQAVDKAFIFNPT